MRHIRHCVYFRVSSLMNQATWLIKLFSPFSIMGKSPSMRRGCPFFTSCHFPFPCRWGCCPCYHGSTFEYGVNRSRAEELWSSCNAHWNHLDSAPPKEDKDLQDSTYLCVQWRYKRFLQSGAHWNSARFWKLLSKGSGLLKIQPSAEAPVTEHSTSIWLKS